jgi:peptide chain release factor
MWVQISSGKGPAECELAVSLFLKVFLNEINSLGIAAEIIAPVPGSHPGTLRSALLRLEHYRSGVLNTSGTILWICKSPYRANHKRKNWFVDFELFDEPETLLLSETDVRFETMRSPGPGGQNVNKVESAVRATHQPTGLSVTASEERSQFLNKKLAMARLAKLIRVENEQNTSHLKLSMWAQHQRLVRGNPLQIYEGMRFTLKSQ